MRPGATKFGLIGHSHAVCLLDALGPWRSEAGIRVSRPDQRYGEAFQGWFDSGIDGRRFVLRPSGNAVSEVAVCLITGGMESELISLSDDGASTELGVKAPFLRFLDHLRDRETVISV